MKHYGLLKKRMLFSVFAVLFLCVLTTTAYAQEITVTGKVVSSNELPVSNAEVRIKGNKEFVTTTSQTGEFTLKASKREVILVNKPGYVEANAPVSAYIRSQESAHMSITLYSLIEGDQAKEEIYVLNGSQNRERVTGAYSQMNFSEVVDNPIVNNMHKATGHLSGLLIFQSNGEPGVEAYRALVRGQRSLRSNSPVILVDGFERDMSLLDPNEIESITVMKDAAATAQYGLQGGNGIISVTTKRGKVGKIKVTLNASAGIKQNIVSPGFLNSYDYAKLYNEANYNDYDDGTRTLEELQAFKPTYSDAVLEKYRLAGIGKPENDIDRYLYPDINWYDKYVKKYTWQQRYSISALGGTSFAKYFVSLGYTRNDGVFNVDKNANSYKTNADMNLITLRSNLDIQATKMMLITAKISARQEQRTVPGDISNFVSRVFQSLYRTPSNAFPVLNPDGSLGGTKDYTNNPYGLLNREGYSLGYIRNLDADVTLEHKLDFITRGLKVWGTFAFDTWFEQHTKRNKSFAVYGIETTKNDDGTLSPVYNDDGVLQYIKTGSDTEMGKEGSYPGSLRKLSWKINMDYQRDFGKHSVYGMVGYFQRQIHQENNSNLPRQYLNLNARVSYAYDNRYLFEFNAGYEGSEQFPKGDRFGFFPAVSAGWILTNEKFIPQSSVLNFLKLRGSYGVSGNDDTGGYFAYLYRFTQGGTTQYGKNLPSSTSARFTMWDESAPAQPNVTWEKVRKANIGIDATMFNNKLDFSFDMFLEKNKDIMVTPPIPYLLGTRVAYSPLGRMENKGIDLSVSYTDKIGALKYRVFAAYTTFKDKVIDNAEKTPVYPYQTTIGRPRDQAWGFEAIGYFTQADIDNPKTPSQSQYGNVRPGDIMYKDQNGDGVIDEHDRVFLGRQLNNNQAALQLELYYKGFDFSIQLAGQYGGSMSLNNETAYEFYQNGGVMKHHLNRFNPQDPDSYTSHGMKFYKGDYPRLSLVNTVNNRQSSSFWRVPTDLLRIKTAEFGYTFNANQLKKLRLESLRLYLSGYNLATWSKTDLVDVEANAGSGIVYPIQRIWNFGVRISF